MNDLKPEFTHILITGASSGIGEALALHYAAPGVMLSLSGRDEGRLASVSGRARVLGANVHEKIIDVTDRAGMILWVAEADDCLPVDLVIANAGISAGMGGRSSKQLFGETPEQVRRLFDVNVQGVFNTIDPLLPRMQTRGRGHIALMSSMAGFRGWPGAPAYCATKAAVRSYGEALRGVLASTGVKVHVICPGFVESRMTAVNRFPMPFIMRADRAARIIARGIHKNHGRIAFPFLVYACVWLCAALPDSIAGRILRAMPAKASDADKQ